MRSAGKRRRLAKRRNGSPTDDTDYDPGVKVQRPRKAMSGSVMKMKSPGRTRLTLAGTASTIGYPPPPPPPPTHTHNPNCLVRALSFAPPSLNCLACHWIKSQWWGGGGPSALSRRCCQGTLQFYALQSDSDTESFRSKTQQNFSALVLPQKQHPWLVGLRHLRVSDRH